LRPVAKDLDAEVAAGRLRDALYYQLNVLPVSVPALRERPEDLPMEANALLQALAQRDRLPPRHFSLGAQTRLQAHSWPGNLRELRGLIQRLLVLGGEPEISALELDQALTGNRTISGSAVSSQGLQIDLNQPLREARDQFERAYLLHWLDESEGSVGKLAKATGMERTHLYRKLRDLGIDLRGARDN
jgi:two-component system nitrogen regulation response regulator NtrX